MRKAFELPKDVNQCMCPPLGPLKPPIALSYCTFMLKHLNMLSDSTQRLQFDQNNMKERELLLREVHMMQAIPHEIPLHFNNPHAYGPHSGL